MTGSTVPTGDGLTVSPNMWQNNMRKRRRRTDRTRESSSQQGRCYTMGSKGDWANVIDMQPGEWDQRDAWDTSSIGDKNRPWLTNNDVLMCFIICSRSDQYFLFFFLLLKTNNMDIFDRTITNQTSAGRLFAFRPCCRVGRLKSKPFTWAQIRTSYCKFNLIQIPPTHTLTHTK